MAIHDHFNCCISLYAGDRTVHVFHAQGVDDAEFMCEVNRVVPTIAAELGDTTEAVGLDVETILSADELTMPPGAEKPTFGRMNRLMNLIRESFIAHGLSPERIGPGRCI